MKLKVFCDCTVVTGRHSGEKNCRSSSYNLEVPDNLDEASLNLAIEKSVPKNKPLVTYEFNRYEIVKS